jgi:hypothetical protein
VDLTHLPNLRERYGADLLLVRPDQHIAWRGAATPDPEELLLAVVGAADIPNVVSATPSLEEITR